MDGVFRLDLLGLLRLLACRSCRVVGGWGPFMAAESFEFGIQGCLLGVGEHHVFSTIPQLQVK